MLGMQNLAFRALQSRCDAGRAHEEQGATFRMRQHRIRASYAEAIEELARIAIASDTGLSRSTVDRSGATSFDNGNTSGAPDRLATIRWMRINQAIISSFTHTLHWIEGTGAGITRNAELSIGTKDLAIRARENLHVPADTPDEETAEVGMFNHPLIRSIGAYTTDQLAGNRIARYTGLRWRMEDESGQASC